MTMLQVALKETEKILDRLAKVAGVNCLVVRIEGRDADGKRIDIPGDNTIMLNVGRTPWSRDAEGKTTLEHRLRTAGLT